MASPANRLDKELVSLFGKQVLAESKSLDLSSIEIEADLVAEGARQLIENNGNPTLQRMIVNCMDNITAITLCKWIREPHMLETLMRKSEIEYI